MNLFADLEELETGAQILVVGAIAFVAYLVYSALTDDGSDPDSVTNKIILALHNTAPNLIPAPIGAGPGNSTPTTPFWSSVECALPSWLGGACPDPNGGSSQTGNSTSSPNSAGPGYSDTSTIDSSSGYTSGGSY